MVSIRIQYGNCQRGRILHPLVLAYHTIQTSIRISSLFSWRRKLLSSSIRTETNNLRFNNKVRVTAQEVHNMWVFEYNPLDPNSESDYPSLEPSTPVDPTPNPISALFSNEPVTNPRANEIDSFRINALQPPMLDARGRNIEGNKCHSRGAYVARAIYRITTLYDQIWGHVCVQQ